MSDIMIDLETMGLRPNAAIISIGAVHFDETNVYTKFETAVSLKSCTDLGLTTDQSTVDWWQKQSSEARARWQREDAPSLLEALTMFTSWLRECGPERALRPWGNGADFDLPILGSAYRAVGADAPWRYYNHRCYRTMRAQFPVAEVPRQGVHHAALDDALYQVQVLQTACVQYGITLK